MKYTLFAFILFLSATTSAHTVWEKTVFEAGIERVQVVKVHSGDTVTVRTQRKCSFGDDCVDGMIQFTVRLPYVAAPSKRQPFARESYQSLKQLLLHHSVLLLPISSKDEEMIGDLVICKMKVGLFKKLNGPCDLPEVKSDDIVKNENGLIYLYRDGEMFFRTVKIKKSDHQELSSYMNSEHFDETATATVTMAFSSLSQSYEGMVHVDPKYTHFDSILFTAQDQAKMLKKGIWSLPLSQQTPPWNL